MDKELIGMLANYIIEYSDSEWATLPVFAKKKDGTLTTAIDYRGVNFQIRGDNMYIPYIGEVLDSLGDATRFICYDCSSGFWGLKMREQVKHFTAFRGHHKFERNFPAFRRGGYLGVSRVSRVKNYTK